MDFGYTEEQELMRKTARDFAEEVLAKSAAKRDQEERFFTEELKALGELGFLGISIPEEYGGAGMDTVCYMIAIEEISRVDASVGVVLSVTNSLVAYPLWKYGTEEQKRKYLVPLAKGEKLGGFCLTEPDSGSDAVAMKTYAVRQGDYYILNGCKNFITSGLNGDLFLLTAVTDKEKKAYGTTCFILERGFSGLIFGGKEKKMGIRSSDTSSLTLEDCRVPVENRIGEEGLGFKIALFSLDCGRLGIAAQAVGIAQGAMEQAVKYAKERKQFNQPIANFQAIQFKLADMETRIQASRLLTYKAANIKDRGLPYTKEASIAKLFASETANWVVDQALQIHGGYGFTKDYPVERFFRDARVTQIYEGTSEIQRMIISKSLINEY